MPMLSHRDRSRGVPGFSLVEVTLCALIIGLVAAVAVPRYAASQARFRLEAAVRRVQADLDLARQQAQATSRPVTVHLLIATDRLEIVGAAGLDDSAVAYATQLAAGPYHCDLAAVDLGGDASLVFDGFGEADSGGSIRLVHGTLTCHATIDRRGEVTPTW